MIDQELRHSRFRIADDEHVRVQILDVEPEAGEMLSDFIRERLFQPLLEELGSDRPELRADLLSSQLMGLGVLRYVLKAEPLASARRADIVQWIGPTVQRYATGKLD
jgi:hypothetical protein